MEEGFLADRARYVAIWVAGKPELGPFGDAKIATKAQHPVQTFRCERCGYLECYAPRKAEISPDKDGD